MSEYGPADVVIDEDGTTWVRLEAYGFEVLANLDKLRESMAPPVGGYRFAEGVNPDGWRLSDLAGIPVHVPPPGTTFLGGV